MAPKRGGGSANRGGGQAGGSSPRQYSAADNRFRPAIGEFPKLVLPLGANGVRITHLDGVQFAEFHFPHKAEWVQAHEIPAQQAAAFSRKIEELCRSADPQISLNEGANFVGNIVPEGLFGPAVTANPPLAGPQGVALVAARGPLIPHPSEWWKSHLKPEVWRRIFPTRGPSGPKETPETPAEPSG
jgi:hypothetical protein